MASDEHFTLAADGLAVREARLRVRAFDNLPAQVRVDAERVVCELVANSLMHARLGPDELIDVTLCRADRRLVIEVDDHGRFSGTPRVKGGLGLRVLDALCADWSAEAGRVCATITI